MPQTSSSTTTTAICPTEAIYGEYSEETELLRNLRDDVLIQTPEGQGIIRLYYQLSPMIVLVFSTEISGLANVVSADSMIRQANTNNTFDNFPIILPSLNFVSKAKPHQTFL